GSLVPLWVLTKLQRFVETLGDPPVPTELLEFLAAVPLIVVATSLLRSQDQALAGFD
ncbi:hypothetical protein TIFTF001_054891, partial [Ficus carica]